MSVAGFIEKRRASRMLSLAFGNGLLCVELEPEAFDRLDVQLAVAAMADGVEREGTARQITAITFEGVRYVRSGAV